MKFLLTYLRHCYHRIASGDLLAFMMRFKRSVVVSAGLFVVVLCGYLLPERITIPVQGAATHDWNKDSFWAAPWGVSGVHRGIDIFGARGTPILSTVDGLVLFTGNSPIGGKYVVLLGPKWRIHYYAHLDTSTAHWLMPVSTGAPIGTLGDTGNAQGKPPHLHYAILRLIPVPWAMDSSVQGYKKAIYLDPGKYLAGH